jgi:hypothetical protein
VWPNRLVLKKLTVLVLKIVLKKVKNKKILMAWQAGSNEQGGPRGSSNEP